MTITVYPHHNMAIVTGDDCWRTTAAYSLGHNIRGEEQPPNYPVPALYDVYADEEYIIMLYQRAVLELKLANVKGETFQ